MISLEEAPSKKLSGLTSIFLRSAYDEGVIKAASECDVAHFDKKEKAWELPTADLAKLIDSLAYLDDVSLSEMPDELYPYGYENGETEADHTLSSTKRTIDYKTKPYGYQLDGIDFGLRRGKWLLLDAPGLGKTLQIVDIAEELHKQRGLKHCLVVCGVNTLKTNWRKEISRHCRLDCMILGEYLTPKGHIDMAPLKDKVVGKKKKRLIKGRARILREPIKEFFVITNIETLRSDSVIDAVKNGANDFGMIVVDEIHKAKSKSSAQGANLLKLDAPYKIAATGTLLLNDPQDAYVPLSWIGVEKASLTRFREMYCVYGGMMGREVVGYKNMDVLKEELDSCSLRRTKDILGLPPKTVIDEWVDLLPEHRKLYDAIEDGILDEVDKVEMDPDSVLAMVTRLRQAAVCPSILTTESVPASKLERAADLAEQIAGNGDKVVIFSNFKEPCRILAERLKALRPVIATGDVKDSDVSEGIDAFQSDPSRKAMICTISKLGTGVTLTAARYAIFVDASWTAAQNEQAEDRIHRIGSGKPTFVYYLWASGTIDERVKALLVRKAQLAKWLVDGEKPTDRELLSQLNLTDEAYEAYDKKAPNRFPAESREATLAMPPCLDEKKSAARWLSEMKERRSEKGEREDGKQDD